MAVSSPQDFVRRLSQRLEEDARITRDAQEWERCIREAALEEGRQEGREEMRGILEPKHQAELEAVHAEKQTIAKNLKDVETKLEELKELRERDNEQMEELKAQVKEKDDHVQKLEGKLANCKTKLGKVCAQLGNLMTGLEADDHDLESNGAISEDDDELAEEHSEASSEPGTSKKRRLSFSSTSSPPPNLLPELNHRDTGGNSCECGVDYDSQEQLKEHLSFMETGRRFLCQICRDTGRLKSYPQRKGLRNHMLRKHNQPIYGGGKKSCDFCGVAFITMEKLEHHLTTNPGTGRLVCPAAFGLGSRAKEEQEGEATPPAKQAKTVE